MTQQLRNVDEVVARALTAATGDDSYDDLDEADKGLMLQSAMVAIEAHTAWLEAAGFRLVPPGMTIKPKTDAEAQEMARQVKAFIDQPEHARNRRKGLLEKPRLMMPYDA